MAVRGADDSTAGRGVRTAAAPTALVRLRPRGRRGGSRSGSPAGHCFAHRSEPSHDAPSVRGSGRATLPRLRQGPALLRDDQAHPRQPLVELGVNGSPRWSVLSSPGGRPTRPVRAGHGLVALCQAQSAHSRQMNTPGVAPSSTSRRRERPQQPQVGTGGVDDRVFPTGSATPEHPALPQTRPAACPRPPPQASSTASSGGSTGTASAMEPAGGRGRGRRGSRTPAEPPAGPPGPSGPRGCSRNSRIDRPVHTATSAAAPTTPTTTWPVTAPATTAAAVSTIMATTPRPVPR